MRHVTGPFVAIVSGFFLGSAQPACAGIIWGSPAGISGDTDVSTAGTLVGALDLGSDATAPTVNGVSFTPFDHGAAGTIGNFTFSSHANVITTGYSSSSAPFSNLSASYQQLLASFTGYFAPASFNLTMSGLTAGDHYAFEWWSNQTQDGNGGAPGNIQLQATDGNSVILNSNPSAALGGLGQFVIGNFTANGAGTETVTFTGLSGGFGGALDALQLRDLGPAATPEPSSFILFGMAFTGLGVARWRKRKQSA
jgi:hypothetical protein